MFITNEDDCSAPPNTVLFDASSFLQSSALGAAAISAATSSDTFAAASRPRATDTTSVTITADCHSNETTGLLYPVGTLADYFKSLKADPAMLFVSAIAAPVKPYTINYSPSPYAAGENQALIAHSCTRSDGAFADPAVRMSDFSPSSAATAA